MGASALGTGTEEVMEGAVITALYGIFQRRRSWECCISAGDIAGIGFGT